METSAVMEPGVEIDPVQEMRLRTWARQHYTPSNERDTDWHPIVLDEMRRKDHEHAL